MEPRALTSTNTTPYTTPHKDMKEAAVEKMQRALADLSLNGGSQIILPI
jgi:hypothetical protein